MRKKKKSGGRNPVEPSEKVVLVGFYTKQKNIDHFGGLAKCREWCKETLELAVEYEQKENETLIVNDEDTIVTHWMPLPEPPIE